MTLSMTNFVFDATSLFEIWTPPVAFTEGFFLFLIEWYSFFFFFLPWKFFFLRFFHEKRFFPKQRASTCEFCRVRDANNMKNELAVKISSKEFAQVRDYDTFLTYYLSSEIRFFKITFRALGDF